MRIPILLSYWYYRNVDLEAFLTKYFGDEFPVVFADSGAFSAMTQSAEITIQEYAEWIKRWGHFFTAYSNLDVIMDAQKTYDNQRRLEDLGLNPLPVFHVAESWDWLDRYIENYTYIALGVAGNQRLIKPLMGWLVQCFKRAQGRAVFHGFALTSLQVLSSFPWYSVDSSTWTAGVRYGRLIIWDEFMCRFRGARLGDYNALKELARPIRQLGFNWLDFTDPARNEILVASALSFLKAQQYLRRRHGEVKIPGCDSSDAGLHLYLVGSSPLNFICVRKLRELWKGF